MVRELPVGLRQVLEVYRLVRWSRYGRIDAVKKVAERHRVAAPTVSSALTRSISLSMGEVDQLLRSKNYIGFRDHLIRHFPAYQEDIESFFDAVVEDELAGEVEKMMRPLFPDEQESVFQTLLLSQVSDKLQKWSKIEAIPQDIRCEMTELSSRIKKA